MRRFKKKDKTIDEMIRECLLKVLVEHSNAVIDIKVDNGMMTSKVKGNLAGIALACADMVCQACEQANKDPKDVLKKIGELIDKMYKKDK